MYVCFFVFMVWNYYFISARWLPPLRINKVKVKVKVESIQLPSHTLGVKLDLLFKLSYLNSNFALALGYLNTALNNPAQLCICILSYHTQ